MNGSGLPVFTALKLYRAAAAALEPGASFLLQLRARRGDSRERERLGESVEERPEGCLLWLHGVSVGESLSLLPLLEAIAGLRPDLRLLVTSRTRTSAEILDRRLPKGVLRSYAPLDLPKCVKRFLQHWRPSALVLAESELWPGMISGCHEAGVPVALINARLSERSIRNWFRFRVSARMLLGSVSLAEVQDPATAAKLVELGTAPGAVRVSESLKAAGGPLPCDPKEVASVQRALAGRFAWLAASTHEADEGIIFDAHARIAEACPDACLVVVPRHPERGGDLVRAAQARGLQATRRSSGLPVPAGENVYIADTLGELGLWYRALPVAFLGGSFGGVGGHNPFEPAALGATILHGPDIANFDRIYEALDLGSGACPVEDGESLSRQVLHLLEADGRPGDAARKMADQAARISAPTKGEAERLARRILGMIDRCGGTRGGAS